MEPAGKTALERGKESAGMLTTRLEAPPPVFFCTVEPDSAAQQQGGSSVVHHPNPFICSPLPTST